MHIINSLASGGAQKLVIEMVNLMANKKKVEVEILVLTEKGNVFKEILYERNIKLRSLNNTNIYNVKNILLLRKFIKNTQYDIVHVHLFPSSYWVSLATLFITKKPKLVFTEHSTHNRRREKKYFRILEKIIYSNFDKVISISNKTQENLVKWLNINRKNMKKFSIIENGIDYYQFNKAIPYTKNKINDDFNENTKLICMVGRFSKQKDQLTLINAIKRLPEYVHLLLIGEGELLSKYKLYSKKINVHNRVHFLGYRDDIAKLLKTVDIVVLSSNWEGFGLAAVEGMASGKPVIASNVEGLSEVVEGAGLIFQRGDSEDLARKIYKLISDKKFYNNIKDKCLERAKNFKIETTVEHYLQEYIKLLDVNK